jgi:hypothetical protein
MGGLRLRLQSALRALREIRCLPTRTCYCRFRGQLLAVVVAMLFAPLSLTFTFVSDFFLVLSPPLLLLMFTFFFYDFLLAKSFFALFG